jgi:SAM-dependent methyltransferase
MTRRGSSELYGADYYENCLGPHPYRRGVAVWHQFFEHVADRIVDEIAPATALDAGCGIGFLVEALRARGVEAEGFDVSEYAISQVPPAIARFCRVAPVTEPLDRRYDLIICMEVLEHVSEREAREAIVNFASRTDAVLYSSTPDDLIEQTHINVQPVEYWSRLFAEQGLYRDFEFDPASVAPHAGLYGRREDDLGALVEGYERERWLLLKRLQGLESERALAELRRPLRRVSRRLRSLVR